MALFQQSPQKFDCIIIGAGLSGTLLALFLKTKHPHKSVLLIDSSDPRLQEKTWSFHESNLSAESKQLLAPVIEKKWQGYDVFFPRYSRTIPSSYYSIRSDKFYNWAFESRLLPKMLNTRLSQIDSNTVTTHDGLVYESPCIIISGFEYAAKPERVGYQKFVGLDVALEKPHGLVRPILMDCKVNQKNSFRFFYVLPWSPTTCLIEDTRYEKTAELDTEHYTHEILNYAKSKGWKVARVLRKEQSALPIPLSENWYQSNANSSDQKTGIIGVAGNFFHPTTGYSIGDACKIANQIASLKELTSVSAYNLINSTLRKSRAQRMFYYLLNQMLFTAPTNANESYRMLERFYKISTPAISDFYASKFNILDFAELMLGKPPVPVHRAAKTLASFLRAQSL